MKIKIIALTISFLMIASAMSDRSTYGQTQLSIPRKIQVGSFDPHNHPFISTENDQLAMRFTNSEYCQSCNDVFKINFEVRDKATGHTKNLIIANYTEQADFAYILNSERAVIIGRSSGSITTVNVINLLNAQVDDFFTVGDFTISPNGRFIAFTRTEGNIDVYQIYDVLSSPNDNRQNPSEIGLERIRNAGKELFATPNLDSEALVVLGSDGFFWTDPSEVTFLSCTETKCYLVSADLSLGISNILAKKSEVLVSSLYTVQGCLGQPFDGGFIKAYDLQKLTSVAGQPRFKLFFNKISCLNRSSLEVTILSSQADLSLALSTPSSPIISGSTFDYTIKLINNGPNSASNIRLTFQLPQNTVFVSAFTTQGSCSWTTTVSCNFGSLDAIAPNNQATVSVKIKANCGFQGALFHLLSVLSDTPDPNASNNNVSGSVTVTDIAPVVIFGATPASPNTLWPPNHQMVDVAINYSATDNCTQPPSCSLSVTSNEPVNGTGDGDTAPDWEVVSPTLVRLRAERAGSGTGRIYTITVSCSDSTNNTTRKTVTVTVPKNRNN